MPRTHHSVKSRIIVECLQIFHPLSPIFLENKEESIANHSNNESRILITEQIPPPEHNTVTMAPVRKVSRQ